MKLDLKQIELTRKAYASLAESSAPAADCPSAEELWLAIRGETDKRERRRIVEHISSCAGCAMAWRLAMQVLREADLDRAEMPPRNRRWQWRGLAIAASLAVIGFSLGLWSEFQPWGGSTHLKPLPPPSEVGSPGRAPAFRTPEELQILSLLPEADALPRQDCVLRWSVRPNDPEAIFNVTVLTGDLQTEIAAGTGLSAPEFRIPENRLANLAEGTQIVWQVRAEWSGGDKKTATFLATVK